ncbi:MAG: stage III sporulation protein AA [Clostridia bacterium]|nr:stage III sporulation protein AA [Clostridia bacterium]
MKFKEEILIYFPSNICNLLKKEINEDIIKNLQEIRIRCNRPIILKLKNEDKIIDYIINQCELLQVLEKICNNSIYAYKNQICNGFITVKGGHRIGITGTAVIEGEKVISLKYINGLNFRIAREVLNCSEKIIGQIIDKENNTIYNTLIVSPPGKGKTTMLRDIIRKISNGISEFNFLGKNCGVIDERGEIAAMYHGIPQNDIGIRTDVIENISKAKGMKMLIRSMTPEIIACDEIGSKEDIEAIKEALLCRSKRNIYNASEKQ